MADSEATACARFTALSIHSDRFKPISLSLLLRSLRMRSALSPQNWDFEADGRDKKR